MIINYNFFLINTFYITLHNQIFFISFYENNFVILVIKYLLVNVVAKRAKEIENNGFYQMKECEYKSVKPIGRALEEIAKDLVRIKKD